MDFLSMNKLELEGADMHNEEEEILKVSKNEPFQEDMIDVSCQIVMALEQKEALHNENYPDDKVSLQDLKSVFVRGASDCSDPKYTNKTCAHLGMARTNMFLRMKTGEKMEVINAKVSFDGSIDFSECLAPSELDFEKADEDIKEYEINTSFANVEDLYIDEQETKFEDLFEV